MREDQKPLSGTGGTRVAMLVFKHCAPDTRVMKEAEHLAATGKQVRVYCLARSDLPDVEVVNGVEYRRFALNWSVTLKRLMRSWLNRRRS
jgi:hypothetical protein